MVQVYIYIYICANNSSEKYLCVFVIFRENVTIILLYVSERFVFVMKTPNVFCEVVT